MDISGGIDAAVDSAVAASTGSSPATPSAESGATSAATSPTAAPADASGPEAQTTSASSTDAPTAQASVETPKREDTPKSYSPPPPEKWEGILSNQRREAATKAAEDVWARDLGVPPQTDRNVVRQHVQALLRDPRAYHAALGQLLGVDAQNAQPQATRQPAVRPKPTLRAEDGTLAYAAQDVDEMLRMQADEIEQRLAGRIEPLQQSYEQARVAQIKHEARTSAQEAMAEYRTWPGWTELEKGIAEDMARDGRVTPESAYARRYSEWSKSQTARIKAESRKEVLAEIEKAPVVTSTVKPGAAMPPRNGSRRSSHSIDQAFDDALRAAGMS